MNRLRSNQIFAILLVSAAFPLLCRTDAFTIEGIFGAAIAAVVQLLLCLPMLRLYHTSFSFCDYARKHRILPLFFLAYLLIQGGISFVRLQSTSQDIALPFSGKFLAAALIALVCLYTVSLGIQALARSSTVILGILILTLILMCIGAIPQAEPQNLSLSPDDTIWRGFLHSMIHADELPLLFLLLDFTEKTIPTYHPHLGRKVSDGCIPFRPRYGSPGQPHGTRRPSFFAIVSVSQPLSTQRADAIYLLVFVMLCVLRITLFTVLAAHLLRLCFPKLRYTSTVCLLPMLGISWGASAVTVPDFVSLAFLGILVLLIPGLLLFLPERRRQAT